MDKRKLSGFWPVFKYTLQSQMKNAKYLTITFVCAAILIFGIGLVMVMVSEPEEDVEFDIKTVTVCDETGLGIPDYKMYAQAYEDADVAGIEFKECSDAEEFASKDEGDFEGVLVVQRETEDGFILELVTSELSDVADENLDILATSMTQYFQMHVYGSSGLSEEALTQALLGVTYSVTDFGDEEEEMGKEIVTIVVVMLFLFVVYMMVLMYGQQICTEVSIEKTSKLVEQLLMSVTPYGLVSGKILGVIASSIIQFLIWVISVLLGIFGGDKISALIYEGYESKLSVYMDYLSNWFGEMAFGVDAIILSVLLMVTGLVFYLIIAGVAGSMVTKPEDASNVQVVFVMPLIVAFFFVMFAIMSGEGSVAMIYHLIPFTSAMVTPGAVLLGDASMWLGLVSLLINVIGSALLLLLAAKVYKALLFYTGKLFSLKAMFKKNK